MSRESSAVTRLIESAQTRPIDAEVDSGGQGRREITRTVKIVMNRARSLPVAVALALIAAAFLGGVLLGEVRETHELAPVVIRGPAAPSPAAAPVAAPDTGFDLRVEPPGAAVVLDGAEIGRAPLRVRNLIPGEHVIELAAEGYFARRLSVTLEPDEPRTLEIALDRLEPEPEPEPEPERAPAAAPEPAAPPPAPRRTSATGTLKIGSKPPCEVFIDGRAVGTTPEVLELTTGRHAVSLVNQTYAIRERIGVRIKRGETVRILRDYSDRLESSAR